MDQKDFNRLDDCTRRDFLTNAAGAAFGLGIAGAFHSYGFNTPTSYAPAKRVIYLFMNGGMSQLDTFSPKVDAASDVKGPLDILKTSADGINVSQLLPRMAKQMHHVAVIESMYSNQGAHEQGVYLQHTNYEKRGTIDHPGLGSWVSRLSGRVNNSLPANVVINGGSRINGSGFMERKYAPLPIDDPKQGLKNSVAPRGIDGALQHKRQKLAMNLSAEFMQKFGSRGGAAGHQAMYDEALTLMDSKDLEAFDIRKEPEHIRKAYGEDNFGQGCLLARRLIEREVRHVEVNLGGWDTHSDNFNRLEGLTDKLDRALSALLADLHARGLLEETLVVLSSEFGRTPEINGGQGRDHYAKAFTCLMAGGGVKGGQIYGKTDKDGREILENTVKVVDFNSTIAFAMGLPYEERIFAPNGRPFTLGNKGNPIPIF